ATVDRETEDGGDQKREEHVGAGAQVEYCAERAWRSNAGGGSCEPGLTGVLQKPGQGALVLADGRQNPGHLGRSRAFGPGPLLARRAGAGRVVVMSAAVGARLDVDLAGRGVAFSAVSGDRYGRRREHDGDNRGDRKHSPQFGRHAATVTP